MEDETKLIPAAVADRYETCMAIVEDKGSTAIAATMEMWSAILEIYTRKLWRARFNTVNEWVDYIAELGYTGLSRSNIYFKLQKMKALINGGVKQEIAAAAVTAVPGAIALIGTAAEFHSAVGEQDPNEYVWQLSQLTPGEAIRKAREDKGNTVSMWLNQIVKGVRPGEISGVIVRSCSRGMTAYDVRMTIEPQIPGNHDLLPAVTEWALDKFGGHQNNARVK